MTSSVPHIKYRPQNFESVVGQDAVVKALKSTLERKQSQSFLFTGPSGVGKTTLSRIIGRYMKVKRANIIEVDAATYTGIDAMRQLTEMLKFKPLGGDGRLFIVDEAHALSKQAWQSLLKSIEEPPEGTYWCLCTTEPSKIPKTIQTRCSSFNLGLIDSDVLYKLIRNVAKAEGIKIKDKLAELIAERSDGSARQALNNLVLCVEAGSVEEVEKILSQASDETKEAIDLCRYLMKTNIKWKDLMKLVRALAHLNSESVRIVITRYMVQVAMNKSTPGRAVDVLNAFAIPYPPNCGAYPIVLSLSDLMEG